MKSVLKDDEPLPPMSDGFVNVIWNDDRWKQTNQLEEEPIEGCTLHDVGWMRVAYQEVLVDFYVLLRDTDDWYREYRRPPEVAHA